MKLGAQLCGLLRAGCNVYDPQSGTVWDAPLDGDKVPRSPSAHGRPDREPSEVESDPRSLLVAPVALAEAGYLDEDVRPPDLSRWVGRTARRTGPSAAPAAGTPEATTWNATWLALTASARATSGRAGTIPAFRLREPGTWPLDRGDAERIAAHPAVPPEVAAALRREGELALVVTTSDLAR